MIMMMKQGEEWRGWNGEGEGGEFEK